MGPVPRIPAPRLFLPIRVASLALEAVMIFSLSARPTKDKDGHLTRNLHQEFKSV